jgi:hypothetical protein
MSYPTDLLPFITINEIQYCANKEKCMFYTVCKTKCLCFRLDIQACSAVPLEYLLRVIIKSFDQIDILDILELPLRGKQPIVILTSPLRLLLPLRTSEGLALTPVCPEQIHKMLRFIVKYVLNPESQSEDKLATLLPELLGYTV